MQYFGLDGLTFGILHFTANELPELFEMYKSNPVTATKFDQMFPFLSTRMSGACLNPAFVCDSNRAGYFNCDATFRPAFLRSVQDPDMQKEQLRLAYNRYVGRVNSLRQYNFRSAFVVAGLAAIMNNLPNRQGCRISEWVQTCSAQRSNEPALMNCMLDIYVQNGCRNSVSGARSRRDAIVAVFRGAETTPFQV